jgi:hypothetical protein
MRTQLDETKSWFLESLVYEDELHVVLVEGLRADEPEDIKVGQHILKDIFVVEPSPGSRRAVVQFLQPVAWQVVDESYTSLDKSEVHEDTCFLSTLTQSAYLQYVETHHGWFKEMVGPATHYRLWTENEVIDVIGHEEPVVRLLESN